MVYSTRRFVFCLTLCYFILVFFSPFSIAITSLGEERANFSAFYSFVRFPLVWFCLFPLSLSVLEGLRFVIVARPGLFSYYFFFLMRHLFGHTLYLTAYPFGASRRLCFVTAVFHGYLQLYACPNKGTFAYNVYPKQSAMPV